MAVNGGEQVLHMLGGAGATSYAKNSTLQEKAIHRTKPIVEQSIKEVYNAVSTENLVVADLGCSSSPNTLLVLLEIVEAIDGHCRGLGHEPPEIQYFLNDLPGNDFNTMFQYSAQLDKKLKEVKEIEFLPYYIVAVPGSFYGRLFPSATVHFFHSSYSLMWLSQGILDEAKVNAFNLPTYAPSMEEVTTVVENEGLFHLEQVQILETNWDPIDDSMFNNSASGENVAKWRKCCKVRKGSDRTDY
ncbi:anthranilate O-methyltransferase 3-like isoform X2 [Iris pallida]|uniref:Anthranilate O-methyltransferase 3-like isoform X2 n=1 Tax=Iris pallida TaxID=29817 RepID=A0AAX6E8J2_IRIPA|nr:anthranilate O-methyltransferase 3-like isoform X2 [Iris pallida]